MRSLITLVLLSGCIPTVNDSGIPTPSDSMSLDADAKRCTTRYFRDVDGDGFGTSRRLLTACSKPPGFSAKAGDCDDRDSTVNPGAAEVCDGRDQNCNGVQDELAVDAPSWYQDADGDGHGNPVESIESCTMPSGYASDYGDCDDTDAAIHVGAPEVCDQIDNNCDDDVDTDPVDGVMVFPDADGDGFGLAAAGAGTLVCVPGPGVATMAGDCDDARAAINPDAPEICDGIDQDCTGMADDNAVDAPIWYVDRDGDTYGDAATARPSCQPIPGATVNPGDCDDSAPSAFPQGVEICDGIDNDCTGFVDDNPLDGFTAYRDQDGDGFGDPSSAQIGCSVAAGFSHNDLDCNDSDAMVPGFVDLSGSVFGTGTLVDPQISIQTLIDRGAACIVVSPGTYQENLEMSGYTGTIQGLNGSDYTTLEGLGNGPVIHMERGHVQIKGLTITGGGPAAWSYAEGQDNGLDTSTCLGMQQSLGGGIWMADSNVGLTDVILTGNNILDGEPERPECNNLVESVGGGIYAESSNITLREVLMIDNAARFGAAMALYDSTTTATRLRVLGTPAGYDSDILVDGGKFNADNVLLFGPSLMGLSTQNSATSISQSMIAGYSTGWSAEDAVSVTNGIFLDNDTAMAGDGTWLVNYCDSYGNALDWPTLVGTGNLSVDPGLANWTNDGDLSNDDYTLLATSPLKDGGDPALLDRDGSRSDIGPFGGPSGW